MAIHTRLTEAFGLTYPLVLAPMHKTSGGLLAAAVSNAGGLGLIGGSYGDPSWLRQQLDLIRDGTERPWGVGFITWHTQPKAVELALSYGPSVVFLSFGDPLTFASQIKAAGCLVMCQVQDVEMAREAAAAGADFVVAQGAEAGGHSGYGATLPLVPAVVDAVAPVPVLAAGGIADGRGVAAALMLGAEGALLGSRFMAATESLTHPDARALVVAAQARDTVQTHVFDPIRGFTWPAGFPARTLRNAFSDRWGGREQELSAASDAERAEFARAIEAGDFDTAPVFAGGAVDLINSIEPAAELVDWIGTGAEAALRNGSFLLDDGRSSSSAALR